MYQQFGLNMVNKRIVNDPITMTFRNQFYGSLYAVERLEKAYTLESHEGCVNSLHFNQAGNLLVSGSDDLKLIVWKWASKKQLLKADSGHRQNIFQTKFIENGTNTNGMNIVTSSRDGQVRLVEANPTGDSKSRLLYKHRGPVNKISLQNTNPNEILTAGEDGTVIQYDLRTNESNELLSLRPNNRKVPLYSVATHPFDPEFCVCGVDKHVRVYDSRNTKDAVKLLFPGNMKKVSRYFQLF